MATEGARRDPPRLLIVAESRTRLGLDGAPSPGLIVADVSDPGKALAEVKRLKPDIVLVDADLPDSSGYVLCLALRRDDAEQPTVVMAVPAGHQGMIDRAYESGAFAFESKPLNWMVTGNRLVQLWRVSQTLGRWQEEATLLERTQRMAHVATWHYDLAAGVLHCSEDLLRLYALPPQSRTVPLDAYLARVHPEDRDRVGEAVHTAVSQHRSYTIAYRLELADGKVRFVDEQAEVIPGHGGRPAQFVGAVRDVTEWMGSTDRIHSLSNYDTITGLPNRSLFLDRLNQALAQARRSKWRLGLVYLDLDHFRDLNLTFGHVAGDTALREVAGRLKRVVRSSDTLARMAGDEFVILLVDLKSAESAATVAEKIQVALRDPVQLAGQDVPIGASLGITVFPEDAQEPEDLMRNVESAVSTSKQAGRGVFRFYTQAMNASSAERLTLTANLRGALERGEFVLHYQPLVDVEKGTITGVEALLRWKNPRQGLLSPDRFISILEETGLIVAVGEWALRRAADDVRTVAGGKPLRICVNLSARQFQRPDLVAAVAQALQDTALAPEQLDLEITESLLMQDMETAIEKMRALRDMGVMLSIDDFGTGFSSLSYLSRFPLTTLKIDKSFVSHVLDKPNDEAIAKSIIALARSLKLHIVVEGVESAAQLEFFRAHDCHTVQGYLFGQPMDVEELSRWMQAPPLLKK
ncbi:MAG: EAL domain-containing protein [SAR324 cluster bacterium]